VPTDPDGDGLYGDVNDNGRIDYLTKLLLEKLDSGAVTTNIEAYDFSGNDQIDHDEVVDLCKGS
jgi:hypothetical protein